MRWWSNGLLYLSAVISIMVAVAGVAGKIAKIVVSQDMLKAAIKAQDARINRLEDATILNKAKDSKSPKPPE